MWFCLGHFSAFLPSFTKKKNRDIEMAQQKKNQPAKPEDLSSIIKSHIVEGTN